MVDVARHDRAAGGQLGTHQLHVAVLALGDVTHFRRDDVMARVPHLGDRVVLGLQRLVLAAAPLLGRLAALDGALAIVLEVATPALVLLHVAAVADPVETQRGQALLRVALRAFGVVVLERRVRAFARRVGKLDLGVRHLKIVGAELVLEVNRRGLADVRLVTLLGIARRDVHALLLGQLGGRFRLLGVGELLLVLLGRLVGGLAGLHTRCVAVFPIAAHGLPARHHIAGSGFRIVGSGDRGDHEPTCGLRLCQHLHVVGGHAAAHHHGEFAGGADRVDLLLVEGVSGTVVAADGSLRLGGGDMQRAGADVVDAAVRQLVDELHEAFGFGGKAYDGLVAEQRTRLTRLHVGLPDVHAIDLDAFVARLPHHIHAVVDDERHGIGFAVVFDDLRDVLRHHRDVLGVRVLGAQLDERRPAAQRVIDHIRDRTALAVLRAYYEVGAHVETVSHGGVWIIAHCGFPFVVSDPKKKC